MFPTAGVPLAVYLDPFEPVGNHISTTCATAHSPVFPAEGATKILVQAITQNIRYTLDGTTPTAAIGFQIVAGDPPVIIRVGPNCYPQFFQEAAGAVLQYQLGK